MSTQMNRFDQYMLAAAYLVGPCKYNRNTWEESEKMWKEDIVRTAIELMAEADKVKHTSSVVL